MCTLYSLSAPAVINCRCDWCGSAAFALVLDGLEAPDSQQPRACKRCLPRAAAIIGHSFLTFAAATWTRIPETVDAIFEPCVVERHATDAELAALDLPPFLVAGALARLAVIA